MADEVILDAIARLRVDDGNSVQEIATVVEAIKGELAKLANTKGINVGADVVKGIGPATNELGELLFQLQKIIELGPQFEGALSTGKFGKGAQESLRGLIQGTEQLLALTRQVEAAQNQTAKGPVQGPVVAAREQLRGPNGRFISAEQADELARQKAQERALHEDADRREEEARKRMAANPPAMITSQNIGGAAGVGGQNALQARYEDEMLAIQRRIDEANPGDPDEYSKLNAMRGKFVSAEERMLEAQLAVMEDKTKQDKLYADAYAGLQQAGLNLLKQLNVVQEQELAEARRAEAEAMEAHGVHPGGTPRGPAELDKAIQAVVPDPVHAEYDRLNAAVLEASINYKRMAAAADEQVKLGVQDEKVEQNYVNARKRLTKATEDLMVSAKKVQTADEMAAERAQNAGAPRRALLEMNAEQYVAAQGLPADDSLRSQQLKMQLAEVEAQQKTLASKSQEQLTNAELNKLLAEKGRLVNREIGLQRQITEAKAREAREARGDGGFLGGVFGKNRDDDGFGQGMGFQAGITFKYFALYSAFSAGQRILEGILETTREYTAATNQLGIALNQTQEQADQTAQSYGKIGSAFGIDPLKATEGAVKFIRSFRDASGNVQEGTGEAGARTAGIVFTLEPDDHAKETLQALIAVTKAYGESASAAESVYDKALQVAQQYGYQSAGEVLPGVAAVADIGKESGYDIPQLTALIASVMQQTGVGSDAAAGDVKRFLGGQGDPGMVRLFQQYGISLDESFRERLSDLADILLKASPEERSGVLTSIGSPRIAAAVSAAMAGEIQSRQATKAADDPNRLTAADQANAQLKTFAGQMQQFGAEVKGLFIEIARSGVLTLFGALAKGALTLVDAATELLKVWNLMPDAAKNVIGAFLALAAIAKARAFFEGSGAATGAAADVAGAARFGLKPGQPFLIGGAKKAAEAAAAAAETAESVAALQVERQLALARGETIATTTVAGRSEAALAAARGEGAAASVAASGGFVNLAKGMGRLVLAMAPLAAIIGTIMVILDAKDSSDKQQQGATDIGTAHQDLAKAVASDDLEGAKSAIERIKQARKSTEEGSDSYGGKLIDIFSEADDARMALYAASDKDLKAKLAEMEAIQKKRDEMNAATPVAEWFGRNFSHITDGVNLLEAKGAGPDTLIAAMDSVLRLAPGVARGAFIQPGEGQKGLPDMIKDAMGQLDRTGNPIRQRQGYADMQASLAAAKQASATAGDDVQVEAISQQLDIVNKAWSAAIVSQTQARVEILKKHYTGTGDDANIKATLTTALGELAKTGDINAMVQLMNMGDKAFLSQYLKGVNAEKNALVEQANALAAAAEAARAAAPEGDVSDVRAEQRFRQRQPNVGAANRAATGFAAIANSVVEAAALADPTGDATTKLATGLEQAKARYLATAGDSVSQAKAEVAAARANVKEVADTVGKNTAEWYDAMKALNDSLFSQSQAELAVRIAKINAGVTRPSAAIPKIPTGTQDRSEADARHALDAAQETLDAAIVGTAEYYNALKGVQDAQRTLADLHHQNAAAIRAAGVIPGDPLAQANADIAQAKADLAYAGDSQSYYAALKSLRQAQYDLAQLELQMANDRRQLDIDITDPVAQARAKVAEAAARLRYDRKRGAGKDVLLADEVALRQSQSDAAGAAWNQQFQDMQTNYSLNRISLSAYLSYLQSQHDYLSAVKNKTRQQIDELNQVDQAMKSLTDAMTGQWNLGDIKVPTAYEMRRSIGAGLGSTGTTTTYINFYGSAEAEMRAALASALGQPVLQSASSAPPRI
jgi:hypothetical protein